MAKRLGSLDWKVWEKDGVIDASRIVEERNGVQLREVDTPGSPALGIKPLKYYFICRPKSGPNDEDMITEATEEQYMKMLWTYVVIGVLV